MSDHPKNATDGDAKIYPTTVRNSITLIFYGVFVRVGWIFKTESIVMPAIMDSIGGGGWLRGCLPMLNRLGQSLSPLIFSEAIRRLGRKKIGLSLFIALMGLSFVALALIWYFLDGHYPVWLPYLFLAIYSVFWFSVGLHNLSLSLLYGKLIPANRRGRLMLLTTSIGSIFAIAAAWFLMKPWLANGSDNFVWLFVGTAVAMLAAAVLGLTLVEEEVVASEVSSSLVQVFKNSIAILKTDRNFRLLVIIAATYGVSITLVPHYQACVRENLNWGLAACVPWVIAQNLGAGFFSIPIGQIADRYGYRLALKWTMLILCAAPLLTMFFLRFGSATGTSQFGFQAVFFLLGLTPVTMRTFSNYTLEIADADQQPIYLSTLGIGMALPVVLFSAGVGALVDIIGFETAFFGVVAVLLLGWCLTFRLIEPRA